MTRIAAYIVLDGGPLDGAEIKWPNDADDFPAIVQIGFYLQCAPGQELRVPRRNRHARYEICCSHSSGPPAEEDGLPEQEWAHYLYAGDSDETIPSVTSLSPNA